MRRVVLLILLLASLAYAGTCASTETPPEEKPAPVAVTPDSCRASGGKWQMFNNGCLDHCEYRRGEVTICTMERKMGCYCPGSRCWNGRGCEDT